MRGGVELIREVFGSDSDSDDADELNHPGPSPPAPLMRPGCVVETPLGDGARNPGMFVAREALGEDARRWLLDSIRADDLVDFPDDEPSTAGSDRCAPTGGGRNQAMRFGRDHLPRWALALADAVAKLATTRPGVSKDVSLSPTASASASAADDDDDAIFPREVLARALMPSGVFNQMIVNQYEPGEGLAPHVDLHAFADGVAVVSLRSTVVMDMYPPRGSSCCSSTPVWLRPGDVMFLSRAARWEWSHGIAARVADPAEGETGPEGASWVRRGRRTSVTLRAMREDGHELRVPA